MFRRVLPLQEPDEVPRRNVDAKRRFLVRCRCVGRFFAYLEGDRLLCTETEVTISSLKHTVAEYNRLMNISFTSISLKHLINESSPEIRHYDSKFQFFLRRKLKFSDISASELRTRMKKAQWNILILLCHQL